jgi:hypothetical protein
MQQIARPLLRQAARQLPALTARRQISIVSRLRSAARTFEPHPFERMPVTQTPAKADWGKQIRHIGDAGMLYVPFLLFPSIYLFALMPLLVPR